MSFMALVTRHGWASGTVSHWSVSTPMQSAAVLLGDLDEGAVAGLAAGAEDDVGAVVERLAGRRGAPLGVGEGHVEAARVVGRDDLDVRVGVLGAVLVALLVGDDRRHLVGAEHGGDGVRLGEQAGEGAGEEAGLVLVEDEARSGCTTVSSWNWSTPMNVMSGFAVAAAAVASPRAKPTVMITLAPLSTNWPMLLA